MNTTITTPPHECASADTISAQLSVLGLTIDVFAYDRTPESMEKVERITKALDSILSLIAEDAP